MAGVAVAASPSAVSIQYNGDGFEGKVTSPKASCLGDRTVLVYKHTKSGDTKLYKDTTDSQGRWDTGNSGPTHGKFFAHVRRSVGCDAADSPIIHAG